MANQANLAYYHVAGPVHVFVRIPPVGLGPYKTAGTLSGPIAFLGHTTDAPEPDFKSEYIPVMSSLGGPVVPDDEINVGGTYQASMELSRFNYNVLTALQQFPTHGRNGLPAGTESYLDRGRLIQAQGDSFEVWLQNSFYGTPNAVVYPEMPPGIYYPACRFVDMLPRKLSRDSTKAQLVIKPLSVRIGITGGFISYSQHPSFFVNLPLPG